MKTKTPFRDLFLFFGAVLVILLVLGLLAASGVSLPIILGTSFLFGLILLALMPRLLNEREGKMDKKTPSDLLF